MSQLPTPAISTARAGQGAAVRTILSIDGGGIRGIIPAMVLTVIERRTGKAIAELFHLIAGTSTGGILAVGLTVPDANRRPKYSAQAMVKHYEEHEAEIFEKQWWRQKLSWIYGAAYSPQPLENLLHQYAGETMLSEALTGLLITSWELRTRTAWFFRRAQARKQREVDHPLYLIARATSAAPTYFPPLRLPGPPSTEDFALVDGGVFANNPGMAAWVDAHEGAIGQEPFMVSLGTGSADDPIKYSQARGWGKILWARPVIGVVLDGASDTVEHELGQLLQKNSYYRFQTDIPASNRAMDDASPSNIAALKEIAAAMIRDRTDDIDTICARLQELTAQ